MEFAEQNAQRAKELYEKNVPVRNKSPAAVEASKVYVLLPNNIPVSRAARLQWFIEHLNTTVTIPSKKDLYYIKDIEIVSAIPLENDDRNLTEFLITSETEVEFLAQSYRFVYCLDMSPSQASVDVHLNEILFDEIINSFRTSLLGLCKKFTIPGNVQVFKPCICLTVIVNTPFFISPAQQVLVKGVQISSLNVHEIIHSVQTQFHYIEGRIAHMSGLAYDEIERPTVDQEAFSRQESPYRSYIPLVPSDANFVNMLRYSMLALSLLPEISLSHIIIITDGVVAMPDSNIMESILFQLHYDSISLSFMKVGSGFNPHVSAGYVAYSDLLHFLSCSTLGTCLDYSPMQDRDKHMNLYQQLFLLWRYNSKIKLNPQLIHQKSTLLPNLFCHGIPPLLSKKHSENDIKVPLLLLLYRRMREGYTVNKVTVQNSLLEVSLCRHWKAYIYIQYVLTSPWPISKNITHYEIHVTAPYDFLHDITCLMKKETKSSYRQVVFEKFWFHLIQLATNDIVIQTNSFQNSSMWYILPESVKSGIPLFVINESQAFDSNKLVLTINDKSCPKFTSIWQSVCQIETNNWRKWFHVHKISLILKHDSPLSKYVHLTNSSGQYEIIQCRQAASALYEFLMRWSSFVLIDNHTYLKIVEQETSTPLFCIIRVASKFPCTTLTIGFMTGTPGQKRYKVLEELKEELKSLCYLSSPIKKKESYCCTLLNKPLEKICIRYERVPIEFHTVTFPDGTQPPHGLQGLPVSPLAGTLFTTLSRYLFHQRWIWSGNYNINPKLEMKAISRILSTITKMRLKEGFHLAHSASGIITMVLELPMNPALSCIVQYVLFPPHDALEYDGDNHSNSDDDQEIENDSELQVVTEVWIEPQYGTVALNQHPNIKHMENNYYYELSDQIRQSDFNCVNSLLTLEHLSLMCQSKQNQTLIDPPILCKQTPPTKMLEQSENYTSNEETGSVWIPLLVERIQHIPFNFNPISILRSCQQTELLFSMFTEGNLDQQCDTEKSNNLLLKNIYNDLVCIHDRELEIDLEGTKEFIKQVLSRHVENFHTSGYQIEESNEAVLQWRCFLKGVSVTHVILTFIPASLTDVQNYVLNTKPEDNDMNTSQTSSEVIRESLSLPIYVYDCPLALLVDACVDVHDITGILKRDVFEDHRFKENQDRQEFISLKSEEDSKKEDDDHANSASQHCKTLQLTHCKCFATSLYNALHQKLYVNTLDVQAAMDQCKETIYQVDITEYLQTVCGHLKTVSSTIELSEMSRLTCCDNLKPIHLLIKEKFEMITNKAFTAVPTNQEFYFCDNLNSDKFDVKTTDSDDEISTSDIVDFKSDSNLSSYANKAKPAQMCPLFLHYVCTIQYNGSHENGISIKLLPTCLMDILQVFGTDLETIEKSKLQINLDILCLTLPNDVQNAIYGYSNKGLRTTSFCSDGFQLSGSASEISLNSSSNLDGKEIGGLLNVANEQKHAIQVLIDEIKWLLKDEIAHSLLDVEPVTIETLQFVAKHIMDSRSRESCRLDVIDLNFVYGPTQSYEKFVQEFGKVTVTDHKLCQVEDLYYLSKTNEEVTSYNGITITEQGDRSNTPSPLLDDNNYNGDVEDEDEYDQTDEEEYSKYQWLIELHKNRRNLPNFWLIMQVHHHSVTIYFHCRYLELPTTHVGVYLNIQKAIHVAIKDLCKQVNQYLLLQSLHDTRSCNILLEPEDMNENSVGNGTKSFSKLKSMEEANDEFEQYPTLLTEASLKFQSGEFSCPVVWETPFVLHPRLKIFPGKSTGISALKTVLVKFSVSNRSNMFVYKDNKSNVFYLRLHENYNYYNKSSLLKSNEFENVSRSPSVASLPVGHQKSALPAADGTNISCTIADLRPRVRSFGEKETKDNPQEDTIILKVHGITETGQDVRCQLVQVLQNRLDDAVLDFLSISLERNSMFPLTPEDVRFLQKPFRAPEHIIRFLVQDYSIKLLDSFVYYLRQNLLQYLNIPKYTDNKPHYHFKDYSECDQSNIISEDNIFIYNQSPISGNKGISCIALAVIDHAKDCQKEPVDFAATFSRGSNYDMIECVLLDTDDILPATYLEFRLWNQGRINIESLCQKLYISACHSNWDIIMEYYLLTKPLCLCSSKDSDPRSSDLSKDLHSEHREEHKQVILDAVVEQSKLKPRIINYELKFDKLPSLTYRKRFAENLTLQTHLARDIFSKDLWKNISSKPLVKVDSFELGDEGILSDTFASVLAAWLEFSVTLGVPSVKKVKLNLCCQHSLNTAVKELQNLIEQTSQDSVKIFAYRESEKLYVPFNTNIFSNRYLLIARNFEHWKLYQENNITASFLNDCNFKEILKFAPAVINNKCIPRQKILWTKITNKEITLYGYNWSKDNIDDLFDQARNLNLWLCMRGCLLSSITSQKLGLFQNQIISRKAKMSNNPYFGAYCDVDLMSKYPRERSRRCNTSSSHNIQSFLDTFRDTYRIVSPHMDSVVTNMLEMCEIRQSDKRHKEDLKTLHSMYQSRSSTATSLQMQILMQNSRNFHYCHTPLLFLPRWRVKAARTRDHTIVPIGDNSFNADLDAEEHGTWHNELCTYFISEYKHYLQTLGFMSLQIENTNKKGHASDHIFDNIHFMQKALLGGILIFTIELKEPFLITKLHAIEYNRLHTNNTRTAMNQFMQSFLDECDKVKFIMHLHSFTYDFHLRCVCNYVSENNNSKLKDGYYITDFLNDFMKYYSKAPNYARNLVYTDTVKIDSLLTDGKQLYNFLLAHIKQYQFKHIIMKDDTVTDEVEYILVQTTNTPQLSYKDSQDRQHTDDFDVTSIVTDVSPHNDGKEYCLHMKYYLILTSRREIYPKYDNERKLGKFRTVTSKLLQAELEPIATEQPTHNLEAPKEIEIPIKDEPPQQPLQDDGTSDDTLSENSRDFPESIDAVPENSSVSDESDNEIIPPEHLQDDGLTKKPEEEKKPRPHIEIKQESVNYLGYYSSHEQLMQQLILDCATSTESRLQEMATQGTIHCRTHLLWNKLLSTIESNKLTFDEFLELKALANLQNLTEAHPNLGCLLKESIHWYQDLAKLLVAKYSEHYRIYISPDGSIQHFVILHPRYIGAFMMLSLDLDISRGNIYIVNRPAHDFEDSDICLRDRTSMINGFINCVCFYLWMNMI